jgi:ATP-dependent Lhr-like helicase
MGPLGFHPIVAEWFASALGDPTPAQRQGWEAIRRGLHTLIAAPTGSGKTLAAFLSAIDDLFREGLHGALPDEVRVVYVSPLKALSADIHKNLAEPRAAIRRLARERGLPAPRITAAVRTGDTPQSERAAMLRKPPHILVTTPESLYLLLTAERSREMLRTARTVIVDEIHAVIESRRGAHLALTLERLAQVTGRPLLRLGLSATQKPVEEVARFLVGAANLDEGGQPKCAIVDEGHRRQMDLDLELPRSPLDAVMSHEVWEEYYDRLAALICEHRTTLVFVNTRRLSERVARHLSDRLGETLVSAHHGSLSKEKRHDAEERLKNGQIKALVATASLELGIDVGHVDLACQIGSPHRIATFLQRIGRSGHTIGGTPKGRLFPVSRDDLVESAALLRSVRRGELDRLIAFEAPLDVLAQQIVAETASDEYGEDELFEFVRRAYPYRELARTDFDAVLRMLADGVATRRGRKAALVHHDEVNRRIRSRRSSRLTAITSGGAIPENADYRVVLEPEDLFIGTLNEDFAIESAAGDIFQLGNSSWRILRVGAGTVRVADAHGAPPTIPFWFGEAPGRSDELSVAVSDLRREIDDQLSGRGDACLAPTCWLVAETGIAQAAAEQIVAYLAEARRALGVLPTQDTLVAERFFDEAGGMQLVLHAPFGSRVNHAWGLALRKRFCRQFNFELQAAATEEGLVLSLGPQHSFPLADVFRYLHPSSVRDVLIQAFLDAPVFETRWRWNSTISLAVPRNRNGRKVPPQIQRMQAADLLAVVFPDAAACLENIPGDREVPDHPLVRQTVRDCLEEAMDLAQLTRILERIHDGSIACVARDTPEPSPLCHEIMTARPYAFLDDAPLEERRAQAVYMRRVPDQTSDDLGALDPAAIERVRDEAWPDPRDAEELHDALLTAGYVTDAEGESGRDGVSWLPWLDVLLADRRAARAHVGDRVLWTTAERLPEIQALWPDASLHPAIAAPGRRAERQWTRETALVELLRGRMSVTGPATAPALATELGVDVSEIDAALLALESEGLILRGSFTASLKAGSTAPGDVVPGFSLAPTEWCDRRLLARIHRYTLNRLRAEIEPVSPAEFMRFLFAWQHVDPAHRLTGLDGLREAIEQLDGFELHAASWERRVLPARVDGYDAGLLDRLCMMGRIGWARLSPPAGRKRPFGSTPIALVVREHFEAWAAEDGGRAQAAIDDAQLVLSALDRRGASFAHDLARECALAPERLEGAIAELVAAGLVTSDSFAGLRALLRRTSTPHGGVEAAGRWSRIARAAERSDYGVEIQARALIRRYGVVFRRVLARENNAAPWRELAAVYRRLEARGELRGGRFVTGMAGEQFASPEAVVRLREMRRASSTGEVVSISAADPLNLTGIITPGDRVPSVGSTRIAYRDGVPLAVLEGDYMRPLTDYDTGLAARITQALAGRARPAVLSGFVGG